ncbi:MAG: RNA 2',3'-cyclic phosphodiesterase [Steroidobacterales bacterium]
MRRLFFALWPDGPWSSRLIEAAAPVLSKVGGRALASVDLHVTLCFLGAVDDAQSAALCARAGQIEAASFELAFERLEWWRAARIVAASVACVPPAGVALAAALAKAAQQIGLVPDLKPWRPHVTLLRGASMPQLPAELAAEQVGDAWPALQLTLPVTRFYLAESQGLGAQVCGRAEAPRYATLASWPLQR